MRSRLIVTALILLFCPGFYPLYANSNSKDPWHFLKPEIALGNLNRNQVVPVTFEVKNETAKVIRIASAEGSCRCTSVQSAPDVIPAHKVGTFRFLYSAARSNGAVSETVTIDDNAGRTIVGTFTASVK